MLLPDWTTRSGIGLRRRRVAVFHGVVLTADVRRALADVTAPALVISSLGCASYDPGHARYLVEHLPHARLVEHHDADGPWFLGDVGWVLRRLAEFIR